MERRSKSIPRSTGGARVVRLAPESALERAERGFLEGPAPECPKCGSGFVGREPAFLHCYYCGAMRRIARASLAAQEVFELRSGLRSAG